MAAPQPRTVNYFAWAPQPDVFRAAQKHEITMTQLQEECRELAASLLGRRAAQYDAEVDLASSAAYYGLTSLAGRRTIGEEYTDLMPVTTGQHPLSAVKRAALFGAQVVLPYVIRTSHRAHSSEEEEARERAPGYRLGDSRPTSVWHRLKALLRRVWRLLRKCVVWLGRAEPLLAYLNRWHLALFYLFGTYLHLSKRALGIRYLFLRRGDGAGDRPIYRFLGVLLSIQLLVIAFQHLRAYLARLLESRGGGRELGADVTEDDGFMGRSGASGGGGLPSLTAAASMVGGGASTLGDQGLGLGLVEMLGEEAGSGVPGQHQGPRSIEAKLQRNRDRDRDGEEEAKGQGAEEEEEEEEEEEATAAPQCTLCLSDRQDTAATECGHLFCWTCISECLTAKPECPMCRQPCQPNRILLLSHYQPSPLE